MPESTSPMTMERHPVPPASPPIQEPVYEMPHEVVLETPHELPVLPHPEIPARYSAPPLLPHETAQTDAQTDHRFSGGWELADTHPSASADGEFPSYQTTQGVYYEMPGSSAYPENPYHR